MPFELKIKPETDEDFYILNLYPKIFIEKIGILSRNFVDKYSYDYDRKRCLPGHVLYNMIWDFIQQRLYASDIKLRVSINISLEFNLCFDCVVADRDSWKIDLVTIVHSYSYVNIVREFCNKKNIRTSFAYVY